MKFRLFIFCLVCFFVALLSMFWWSAYKYYQIIHADDPIVPHVTVVEWGAKIIRWDIAIELTNGETYNLETGDAVETLEDSITIITWPDHSITRLGSRSRIEIHEMLALAGYEKIQIGFSLKKGKIWSTVVRALIGDSYFETNLPKNDIIAWVRGTIYEINLDKGYIHAINHAVSLRDSSNKQIILMPGDIVDSENILLKRGGELLDNTWLHLNMEYDAAYEAFRTSKVSLSKRENSGKMAEWYDQSIRWILKHFSAFKELNIEEILTQDNTFNLEQYTPRILLKYYQRIQWLAIGESTDSLRIAIYEQAAKSGSWMEWFMQNMRMWALWESLDSWRVLPGARKILNAGSEQLGESLNSLKTILTKQSYSDEIKKSLRSLLLGN